MFNQKTIKANIILAGIICIFIIGLFSNTLWAAMTVDQGCLDIANISDTSLNAMRNLKTLFGHQSVGSNTISGLTDLASRDSRYALTIKQVSSVSDYSSPVFGHFYVGANGDPMGKITDFNNKVRNTYGGVVNAAFFKFCPYDIQSGTNINDLFNSYKSTMEALKSSYPNITFVHMNCALTTAADTANIKRNQFNTLLFNEYNGRDYIFDIAAIESTHESGARETFTSGGQTYYKLCSEYTTDGVHLSDSMNIGRQRAAKGMIYLLASIAVSRSASDYYVSNSGNDNNTGKSPAEPWQTIAKVNEFTFSPGDTIHFERGGVWRGNLYPQSGDETGCIKYTFYGDEDKPKPVILGSQNKNKAEDWTDEGGNIWSTRFPSVTGSELLLNSSFDENTANWVLWAADGAMVSGARDMGVYDSSPAGYRVTCGNNNGTDDSNIQLSANVSKIIGGKYYELSFRAKADQAFEIYPIKLIQGPSEAYWNMYLSGSLRQKRLISASIGTEWKTYKLYYQASRSASDARIIFYLGNALPENSSFYIDSVSFKELEEVPFLVDAGNIIFDDGQDLSIKVWEKADLDKQNEFWYDEDKMVLKVYSVKNPADLYKNVECALSSRSIIDESHKHHIIYDGLYLAYGAYCAIGGGYAHDIIARNCDICFIGGGDQYGGSGTVRYGNGIEFWDGASNNLVESCNIWEIFDSAVSNQGDGANQIVRDIIYRNNKMWNCEWTSEFWLNSSTGKMHDIYLENNILLNAGGGWSHQQRSLGELPAGRHIIFGTTPCETYNIYIRNNIISKSNWTCIHFGMTWASDSPNLEKLVLDYNTYYQPRDFGQIAFCYNYGAGTAKSYYNNDFGQYKIDTGKDTHSILYENEYVGIEVINSDPAAGAINVLKDKTITIGFSQNIKPYCDYSRVSVRDSEGRQVTIAKSISDNILNIIPENFERDGVYSVFVPIGAVASPNGSEMLSKGYKFSFTVDNGLLGDLNADGQVNSVDLQLCVNVLLGIENNPEITARADLDNNGEVNAADLQKLVNLLLGV